MASADCQVADLVEGRAQSLRSESTPTAALIYKRLNDWVILTLKDLCGEERSGVVAACLQTGRRGRSGRDTEVAVQFIRPRQVLEMIGVSRTTLWRMVQAGCFPRPVCITERNRGYLRDAVEAWMKARADGLPFEPPSARPSDSRNQRKADALAARRCVPERRGG